VPRILQLTVPHDAASPLIGRLSRVAGVIGIQLQTGASVHPPGDIITVQATTASLPALMRLLDEAGVAHGPESSVVTSEPVSLVSPSHARALAREPSEASWEEMHQLIGKESNMTANGLAVMAIAGVLAVVGMATEAIHVVIAGMLIAPGFEPLARVSLGLAAGGTACRHGLADTAKGYAALLAGALIAALALRALGSSPLGGNPGPLVSGALASYWSSVGAESLIVSMVAAVGGGILIAGNRTILTGGVMVALALIPSAALLSAGLAVGDVGVALGGALRWLIDAALVVALCWAVFAWKNARVHRRRLRP